MREKCEKMHGEIQIVLEEFKKTGVLKADKQGFPKHSTNIESLKQQCQEAGFFHEESFGQMNESSENLKVAKKLLDMTNKYNLSVPGKKYAGEWVSAVETAVNDAWEYVPAAWMQRAESMKMALHLKDNNLTQALGAFMKAREGAPPEKVMVQMQQLLSAKLASMDSAKKGSSSVNWTLPELQSELEPFVVRLSDLNPCSATVDLLEDVRADPGDQDDLESELTTHAFDPQCRVLSLCACYH